MSQAPSSWVVTRLNEIAEVRLGRQRSPDRAVGPNMVPYLRAANVTWQGIDLSDVKEMDFSPDEQRVYRLHPGDILLAEASGSPGEVGKPGVYRGHPAVCCFQNTLVRARTSPDLVPFIHWQLLKAAMLGEFARASRGVGIHHLGAQAMEAWPVTLPPLREQHRIADALDSYLSRLDAAVASLERAQAKLKAYRASVLKAAVEGRLVPTEASLARKEGRTYEPADVLLKRILAERRRRWEEAELAKITAAGKAPRDDKWKARYEEPAPPDTSELPELPQGWCWARVEQVAALITKGASPEWQGFRYVEADGVPFIRSQNVRWGTLDVADLARVESSFNAKQRNSVLSAGDVLLNIVGASIGRAAEVPDCLAGANTNQAVALIRIVPEAINPEWLVGCLLSPGIQSWIRIAKVDVARANLSLTDIENIVIPLPPAHEQQRIVQDVARRSSVAQSTAIQGRHSAMRMQRLRQSILKWAFEGKLVDQDPTDEPANVLLARIRAERAATTAAAPARRRARKDPV